mmetsp:Transcript_36984/g.78100  ORF Transcript_36984/g.78100 Transcript_36984/m.78100 type:complete len:288 (+) Transcript_36984:378-1241(+)
MQILLHQQQWHVVDIAHIMYRQNTSRPIDMTKARNLALRPLLQHLPTPTKNNRGAQSHTAQIPHAMLRRLGLLFLPHNRNQRHERQAKVGGPHAELELTQRFQKHRRFDITHGTAHLDETNVGHANIGIFVRGRGELAVDRLGRPVSVPVIVHGHVGHLLDPFLNFVGDVRYDLDGLAEVIPPAFLPDDLAVDLPGGDVVIAREGNGEEALVVPEVEVGFAAVVENVGFAVFEGAHGAGVDVEVGVDFDGGDAEAAALEHASHGRDGDALAEAGDDASCDYDVLHID